mmetsp:Transcript_112977/g.319557  ORF Transcript_112977/g.319557 Transcript_112977/m.319557 type:complete len:420 (-) Transcript_112977:77-1336(-)|eukprot:CAMPEP_0117475736 /NCGR_PEP_ID=MMETSP0784-20121206/9948_1 /TAXON_ID=39447 /ORGANISM="" /LENGTH=419 /DNA_ID=CAMNT_0005269991 /DNA_START=58 /DNA_END=1317 /DNA_ORIENTATION=+
MSQVFEAAEIPGKGRGLLATQPAAPGTEVLKVRLSDCWPRPEDARRGIEQRAGGAQNPALELEDLSDEAVLALWLLSERHDASIENPVLLEHIRTGLPEVLDGVLLWTDAEMDELAGTSFHEAAVGLRTETQAEWAFLLSMPPMAEWLEAVCTEARFVWAKAMVISRQFELDQGQKTVAPGFDLLNHSATPNCAVELEAEAGASEPTFIVVRCTLPVGVGEELSISYGPLPNASLLISHGFVLEDNPFDCVEAVLSFPLPVERRPVLRSLADAGARLCNAQGSQAISPFELLVDAGASPDAGGIFVTRHNLTTSAPLPPTLLATVRLQILAFAELEGSNILSEPGSLAVPGEANCVQQALSVLQHLLDGHRNSAEDDQAFLASCPAPPLRRLMAAKVRLHERQILTAALTVLRLPSEGA